MYQFSTNIADPRCVELKHFLATVQPENVLFYQPDIRLACFQWI